MIQNPRLTAAGLCLTAGLFLFALTPAGRADLLLFELQETPKVLGDNGTINYTALTGQFHSELVPSVYIDIFGGITVITPPSSITIDLFVNPDGSFAASGTGLEVTGSVDIDGDGTDDASGVLLTGPIVAFGFEPPDPMLPFPRNFNGLFLIQGGALTQTIPLSGGGSLFGGFPPGEVRGGFRLTAEGGVGSFGVPGDFTQDFFSDSAKVEIGVTLVPEPSSALLALTAGGVLVCFARFRKRAARPAG